MESDRRRLFLGDGADYHVCRRASAAAGRLVGRPRDRAFSKFSAYSGFINAFGNGRFGGNRHFIYDYAAAQAGGIQQASLYFNDPAMDYGASYHDFIRFNSGDRCPDPPHAGREISVGVLGNGKEITFIIYEYEFIQIYES